MNNIKIKSLLSNGWVEPKSRFIITKGTSADAEITNSSKNGPILILFSIPNKFKRMPIACNTTSPKIKKINTLAKVSCCGINFFFEIFIFS